MKKVQGGTAHGDITKENISSAAKRITKQLMAPPQDSSECPKCGYTIPSKEHTMACFNPWGPQEEYYITGMHETGETKGLKIKPTGEFVKMDLNPAKEHEWFMFKQDKFRCCKKCGIIERRDGKNGKCPGEVKLELRTPAKDTK